MKKIIIAAVMCTMISGLKAIDSRPGSPAYELLHMVEGEKDHPSGIKKILRKFCCCCQGEEINSENKKHFIERLKRVWEKFLEGQSSPCITDEYFLYDEMMY